MADDKFFPTLGLSSLKESKESTLLHNTFMVFSKKLGNLVLHKNALLKLWIFQCADWNFQTYFLRSCLLLLCKHWTFAKCYVVFCLGSKNNFMCVFVFDKTTFLLVSQQKFQRPIFFWPTLLGFISFDLWKWDI